jgi:hypothetical protein
MLTGGVKIIGGGLGGFLLVPCGATRSLLPCEITGSLGFDVNIISIICVLRGAKKSLA